MSIDKISMALEVILDRFCEGIQDKKVCSTYRDEVLNGKMSIGDLGSALGADKPLMDYFKTEMDINKPLNKE